MQKINKPFIIILIIFIILLILNIKYPDVIPCDSKENPAECQTRLDIQYPDKYEVIYYPMTNTTQGELK